MRMMLRRMSAAASALLALKIAVVAVGQNSALLPSWIESLARSVERLVDESCRTVAEQRASSAEAFELHRALRRSRTLRFVSIASIAVRALFGSARGLTAISRGLLSMVGAAGVALDGSMPTLSAWVRHVDEEKGQNQTAIASPRRGMDPAPAY